MTGLRLCLTLALGLALAACTHSRFPVEPSAAPAVMVEAATLVSPTQTAIATPRPTIIRTVTPSPSPTATPYLPLVAIDPGHGGVDIGAPHLTASGRMDFFESEVNLDLAMRIRDHLKDRPVRVLLVRETDRLLNEQWNDVNEDGRVDPLDDLQMRLDLVNEHEADLLLSIHQNAYYYASGRPAPDVGGTVTYYCADRPFADESLRFATLVQEHLVAAFADVGYETFDREVQDDLVLDDPREPGSHLIVLGPESERIVRPSQAPGALSETCFLTHSEEAKLIRNPKVLDRLALAYADAITAFLTESTDAHSP
ncbi:MAG: N-acetylmuramoyl-L-alanine amidase family protein [Anaerolineae bacterium]